MKGSYILVIYLPEKVEIQVGFLGELLFNQGFYLYIGSAMGKLGSSTLLNRVKRHVQPTEDKKVHWHIDYLLNHKRIVFTQIYLIPSLERLECIIAKDLIRLTDDYIKNFGSSDCNCQSHLFYIKDFKGFGISKKFI
ncbi:MAG: GIY-YIG nuclease family protein [Candidatus Lokiarchaeota archaeon]|nr:GIY-YIG nuclease family protein [Candidatus Lokiarchaeota archaeon]